MGGVVASAVADGVAAAGVEVGGVPARVPQAPSETMRSSPAPMLAMARGIVCLFFNGRAAPFRWVGYLLTVAVGLPNQLYGLIAS